MGNSDDPKPAEKASPEKPADAKVGWIEGLAKRSTGLPEDVKKQEQPTGEKSPWSYAGLGLQFAGTVAIFTFMGYELDRRMGWTPWGTVSLAMISVIGSLYLLIKEMMKEDISGSAKRKSSRD